MVKELLTREDFDAAIGGGEGVIVIVDYPTKTDTAHPISCGHARAAHFVKKVIVNNRKHGRYYLAGILPRSEARTRRATLPLPMMIATDVATNTPVWFLFGATVVL